MVTASVLASHPEQLVVWLNGKPADGPMAEIVRSCARWSGVRGLVTIDISCPIQSGSGLACEQPDHGGGYRGAGPVHAQGNVARGTRLPGLSD